MFLSVKTRYQEIYHLLYTICAQVDTFLKRHELALFWILGTLYKFALDALYVFCATKLYAYAGLIYAPNFLKYMVASVLYLFLFAYLPKKEQDVVVFLLHLQFAISIAPMLAFYAFSNKSTRYILMVFLCALLEIYILRRPVRQTSTVHIIGIRNYVTVALGLLVILALVIPVIYNGFAGSKAFDFFYIYQMRANASYPPGFAYLLGWMYKAIVPFAFLLFLRKKKYLWAGVCVMVQLLFYIECGQKYALFILVPMTVVYLLYESGHFLKLVYAGLIGLFLVAILAYQLDHIENNHIGMSASFLIGVRTFFHPASNKFSFYECFSQLPKIYFSDGQIGKMLGLTYPYAGSSGQVIVAFEGKEFLSSNSNTGYLGEGYAQMGFVGMLLMSALFAFILRGLYAYDTKETGCILAALFSGFIVIINDVPLLTTLFTGGLLLVYLLIFIYFSGNSKGDLHGVQRL